MHLLTPEAMRYPLNIAVVGGGLMGCGIAAKLASAGQHVIVFDNAAGAGRRISDTCAQTFHEMVKGGVLDAGDVQACLQRVLVVGDIGELAAADIVFEAIFEDLDQKRSLYRKLECIVTSQAIIASTTSGFTPESLFENLDFCERTLVAHFWNPPHLIPLVEILGGSKTESAAVDFVIQLLENCGCVPVRLFKATPGFIGNRIQFAVLREALHLLREGVADAQTIDMVVCETLGRRYRWIGPLEVADAGGLGTFLKIATHLMPQLCKDETPLEVLAEYQRLGQNGRLTKQGLLRWDDAREKRHQEVRLNIMKGC